MAWFFEGNGQQIGFKVSRYGVLSAYGNCSQLCRPSTVTGLMPRMEDAAASWTICTPASEEHEYDGLGPIGRSLKNFFAENGEKAAGRINFYPAEGKEAALVSLSVLAPTDFAASTFTLLKAAMGSPSFRFVITADFIGFMPENAKMPDLPASEWALSWLPKISEFTHPDLLTRRAYFSRGISLSVRTFD
jgi:hypothetical protein